MKRNQHRPVIAKLTSNSVHCCRSFDDSEKKSDGVDRNATRALLPIEEEEDEEEESDNPSRIALHRVSIVCFEYQY